MGLFSLQHCLNHFHRFIVSRLFIFLVSMAQKCNLVTNKIIVGGPFLFLKKRREFETASVRELTLENRAFGFMFVPFTRGKARPQLKSVVSSGRCEHGANGDERQAVFQKTEAQVEGALKALVF